MTLCDWPKPLFHSKRFKTVWIGFIALLLLAWSACGIKAPPVAPDEKAPLIKELTHALHDSTLILTWQNTNGAPADIYTLYQSKTPLAEAPCEGCPLIFKRLDPIPATSQEIERHSLAIEPGFRYGFKVTATTRSGREGPASNTIRFSYP